MNIIYTKHAKIRMFQREITEEQIISTVENPDSVNQAYSEKYSATKNFPKRALEVIYKKSKDNLIIITCYWKKEK